MKSNIQTIKQSSAGFSMIEVLVASSILVIIVMMLGMLFQQGSNAWRIGASRSDGFVRQRAIVSALQRDLSKAVDVRAIIAARRRFDAADSLVQDNQSFSGSSLKFYAFDGVTNRSLRRITYNLSSLNRTEESLEMGNAGGSWKTISSGPLMSLEAGNNASVNFDSVQAYDDKGNAASSGEFPAFVNFRVSMKVGSGVAAMLQVGAKSAGPDGKWDTKDDLSTWNEE